LRGGVISGKVGQQQEVRMETPRVTETVPDSIRVREHAATEHALQRDRVRASLLAVPAEPISHELAKNPELFHRAA
jgi:hypothetical protein